MNKFLIGIMAPVIRGVIAELLTEENIDAYGDKLFDFIEDAVKASETTIDDVMVLPVVKQFREVLGIPDND